MTELPAFPYHPDPIGTGAVVRSEAECASCGQARGYVYAGPVFAELQAFARPGLHCRRAQLHRGRLPAVRGEGGDHQGTRPSTQTSKRRGDFIGSYASHRFGVNDVNDR
ncbi:CbrC family protein [Streptomyces sp. NPDC029080]|uniref:CbrC family protein n=1 Tax=Streptomyces sp. NPDC029080 TaxID=3155017 RepID=UPI0033CB7B50